ncbi:unnamed protein product, partial [Ectocarpus fasciculatus]
MEVRVSLAAVNIVGVSFADKSFRWAPNWPSLSGIDPKILEDIFDPQHVEEYVRGDFGEVPGVVRKVARRKRYVDDLVDLLRYAWTRKLELVRELAHHAASEKELNSAASAAPNVSTDVAKETEGEPGFLGPTRAEANSPDPPGAVNALPVTEVDNAAPVPKGERDEHGTAEAQPPPPDYAGGELVIYERVFDRKARGSAVDGGGKLPDRGQHGPNAMGTLPPTVPPAGSHSEGLAVVRSYSATPGDDTQPGLVPTSGPTVTHGIEPQLAVPGAVIVSLVLFVVGAAILECRRFVMGAGRRRRQVGAMELEKEVTANEGHQRQRRQVRYLATAVSTTQLQVAVTTWALTRKRREGESLRTAGDALRVTLSAAEGRARELERRVGELET